MEEKYETVFEAAVRIGFSLPVARYLDEVAWHSGTSWGRAQAEMARCMAGGSPSEWMTPYFLEAAGVFSRMHDRCTPCPATVKGCPERLMGLRECVASLASFLWRHHVGPG